MTAAVDYGRYARGRLAGYLQSAAAAPASVAELIATAAARAAIAAAAQAVSSALAGLGVRTTSADVATAVQAHIAALASACPDPATRVRLLATLTRSVVSGASAASTALSTLYRRAAVSQLALAGGAYAPASYDDAVSTRAVITDAIDAEMQVAGDTGADEVFAALRTLRQNVVLDLNDRGAALPRLEPLRSVAALPDVVLAMRRYGAPDRADELVTQADPPHPLFMPVDFLALAS